MRRIAALLCVIFVLALCPVASAASVTVAVKLDARVRGPHLSLADIAEVSGENQERVKQLGRLNLGEAPAPGTTWYMNPALLEPKLAATQADFDNIIWSVPANFKISTLSQLVSGKLIGDLAQAYLERISAGASLSLVERPSDVQAPEGKLELAPDLTGPVRYNLPTTVTVSVKTDGVGFVKVPVRFEVKRYLDVVVTTANMNAGDIVSAQSVRLERMDAGKLTSGYMTDLDKVIGLQLRYAAPPGTVLGERNVTRPLIVKRGETVRLLARVGTLEVAALGIALANGASGDLIKVQNSTTKKIMNGHVQDDKSVLVMNQQGG